MPSLSNYPPGVTGMEPQITGGDEDDIMLQHACGEVFEVNSQTDMTDAALHGLECEDGDQDNTDWSLITREMAI